MSWSGGINVNTECSSLTLLRSNLRPLFSSSRCWEDVFSRSVIPSASTMNDKRVITARDDRFEQVTAHRERGAQIYLWDWWERGTGSSGRACAAGWIDRWTGRQHICITYMYKHWHYHILLMQKESWEWCSCTTGFVPCLLGGSSSYLCRPHYLLIYLSLGVESSSSRVEGTEQKKMVPLSQTDPSTLETLI